MLYGKGKISVRQLFIIYLLAIYSPTVRLLPSLTARYAKHAAILSPLIAGLGLVLMVIIIQSAFKKGNCNNLGDVFEKSIGKIASKCLLSIYLIWLIIMLALYIRYYADRLIMSILPGTNLPILSITIMILVFIAVRKGIESFARLSEFFIPIFVFIFIILLVLIAPSIKLENMYPITHYDILPILKGTYPVLGICGYFVYAFFLGDHVSDKENIKYVGLQSTLYITINHTLLIIMTIGTLGYSVMERANLPFFSAVKSITVLNTIERGESILVSTWVIADFVIISLFVFMVLAVIQSLFNISEVKNMSSPIIIFAIIFSFYFAINTFELKEFSRRIGLMVNIITCYIIPAIVIAIGKLRKTI